MTVGASLAAGLAGVALLAAACGSTARVATGPDSSPAASAGAPPSTAVPSTASSSAAPSTAPPATSAPPSGRPTSAAVIPAGAVPWADFPPGPPPAPVQPVPTTAPPATAPPCAASQLSVRVSGHNGASQHAETYYAFTNKSPTTCLLGGYPRLVATESGHPPVVATHGTYFGKGGPPADVAPGRHSVLTVVTAGSCAAYPGGAPQPAGPDTRLTVTLAGGGTLALPDVVYPVCGMSEEAFSFPLPPPTYPPDAVASLRVGIDAPAQVRAGTTLVYTVTLTNPGAKAVALDPCPSYIQGLAGLAGAEKALGGLDCRHARPVPAHGSETFVMHLGIPATAPSGETTLHWLLVRPGGQSAGARVSV
ncbi:MAG: DUF4232 domain-containing protein, partial [Acidimicrobiales bacterium]